MVLSTNVDGQLKPGTHWRQSWVQHGRLCWKSTVAETGDKSATKSTVAVHVDFVADTVDFVASVYGPKQHGRLCRLSTKSTVLNSTLLPVCTGLKRKIRLWSCINHRSSKWGSHAQLAVIRHNPIQSNPCNSSQNLTQSNPCPTQGLPPKTLFGNSSHSFF